MKDKINETGVSANKKGISLNEKRSLTNRNGISPDEESISLNNMRNATTWSAISSKQ
ncbi:hypothetical protein [Chitinophaga sancti]|uniref:Uncharacterized protein n=1 Tax=Chitinophaga sancti TaxID=1004 RepID=A0A1K1SCE3_9BACT|nr:hypothetical protein [Chitinophaga sancti]WQD63562.1 hypothetical protein U0033_04080 [Chitinophaga sancti]WQG90812.1 hypothetical protein SR876_04835 [Chitinophaga sancti]SFW81735.1 hypothetical protein SAMN05661012_05133 [Chitinophaga sancti]